jgi:hypothetical protein
MLNYFNLSLNIKFCNLNLINSLMFIAMIFYLRSISYKFAFHKKIWIILLKVTYFH